jgi:anti-sigma B factor antagonist
MMVSWIDWDRGGVTVMGLTGRFTVGEGTTPLRDAVRQALDRGRNKIVLNLAEVMYINSSDLGELVRALASVRSSGGQLKLSNVQAFTRGLLQVTRLDTVLEVLPDDESAVKSFSEPA